jgi:homocysteine S-methyltransferase
MDLLEDLHRRIVPADGAMGTELFAAGVARDRCLEELCISDPDLVLKVHRSYLAAGAQLVKTHSFGSNAVRLAAHGFEHRVSEFNWAAAQLAKEAVKEFGAHVAGSVGPLDAAADMDREELFLEQIGALLDGGARVILLESFTDLAELEIALTAKHTLHHCPVIASLACRDDARLPDGTTLTEAFARLREAGADIVGVNCTAVTPTLLAALPAAADEDSPLAVLPSAGMPVDRAGRLEYPVSPEQFGRDGIALGQRGARLLGGCCGTGPAHIAALVAALSEAGLISSS